MPSDAFFSNAQRAEGENEQDHRINVSWVDYNFAKTLEITIKHGRFYSEDYPSDSTGIVINESAARIFGFSDNDCAEAIGKNVEVINSSIGDRDIFHVIGVAEN